MLSIFRSLRQKMIKRILAYSRVAIPLLLGICIGIALSFIVLPFIEERSCKWESFNSHKHSSIRGRSSGLEFKEGIDFDSFRGAEYEPQLIKSKQSGALSAKRPVRHRFAASEVDIKQPLFIAYLSSAEQVNNRLVALNKTISAGEYSLAAKFFLNMKPLSAQSTLNAESSPIVALNLLDAYTLPLITIKHLANQYLGRYKYFMIVPDTTYVRRKITDHIASLTEDEPYLGFTSTYQTQNNCDINSGFILSHNMLTRLSRRLEECEHLFRHNDNVVRSSAMELLDKCIQLVTHKACTTLPLSGTTRMLQYKLGGGDSSLEAAANQDNGLVISHVVTPREIYTLRKSEATLEMKETRERIDEIRGGLENMMSEVGVSMSWPVGMSRRYSTSNRYDVLRWTLIADNTSYLEYDLKNSLPLTGDMLHEQSEAVDAVMSNINSQMDRYRLNKIIQAYRRADPGRGVDFIITLALYDNISNRTETRSFELVRPVTSFQFETLEKSSTDSTHVNMVVPIYEPDSAEVEELVINFITAFNRDRYISLHLVIVYSESEYSEYQTGKNDAFDTVKQCITDIESQKKNGKMIHWINAHGNSLSLLDITKQTSVTFKPDSIVSLSTVTTLFNTNYIQRVRSNTILGSQAYAPIVFYQYNPELLPHLANPDKIEVARSLGHFAAKWYEHLSFYSADVQDIIGRAAELTVEDLLVKRAGLELFRSPDPDCIVRHKEWRCDTASLDKDTCIARMTDHIASAPILANKLLNDGELHKSIDKTAALSFNSELYK